jgi:signal transduction histidine kinase
MLREFLTTHREAILARTRGKARRAVAELALETGTTISAEELETLGRCLDEATARGVAECSRARDEKAPAGAERAGYFTHELRNLVGNSIIAYEVLRNGTVGIGGSTGEMLGRNLRAMRELIARSAAQVRLEAGLAHRERVPLSQYLEEATLWAAIEARTRGIQLTVAPVEPDAMIDADRQQIAAALTNLLQNAFKFTRRHGRVVLRTDTASLPGRALLEVEDECGGLPEGEAELLFRPFEQRGQDRSGLGLGLAIAREGVENNGGQLRARNLPGRGCVFTIEMPSGLPARLGKAAVQGVE